MMKYILFFASFSIMIIISSCKNQSASKITIDFSDINKKGSDSLSKEEEPIYIAIASMTSPRETTIYYKQLIHYLSSKLERTILIKQKKTYEEVNALLKSGQVDFAFICSGAYIELTKSDVVDILVAPVIDNKTYYRAYIIANDIPSCNKFEDLKNLSFAFTDPLSHTGYSYPRKLLKELNTHERIFFSKTHFTYAHDISIHMVNNGVVAGASVHGLIYDYMAEKHPESVKNIKIIKRSEWFGIPPIVTPVSLDKTSFEKYRTLFMDIHNDSLGNEILKKLHINKFVVLEDSIYNNVRKLKEYVETKND